VQKPDKLFFSNSDEEVHEELGSLLPGEYPELKFAFFEPTFKDWALWRPVGIETKTLDPTTRLIYRWAPMNQRTTKEYGPALLDESINAVFISGFGREVWHYGIRYQMCLDTLMFHGGLVKSRIIGPGIWPPEYIAQKPRDPRIRLADQLYFAASKDTEKPQQTIHYLRAKSRSGRLEEALKILRPRLDARLSLH
jgi:hypothetical protein